jgi:hypothetical protein
MKNTIMLLIYITLIPAVAFMSIGYSIFYYSVKKRMITIIELASWLIWQTQNIIRLSCAIYVLLIAYVYAIHR